jgi:hypothetical protein
VTRVLFIGGLGRNGSTLVDRVLGQTPGVVAVGELVFLWERGLLNGDRCGCDRPFRDCPFWAEVGDRAFGGWDRLDAASIRSLQHAVDRNRYIPFMRWPRLSPRRYRRRLERYAAVLSGLYEAIAATSGAELIVDSSKHASTAALLSRVPGVEATVVQLVRDPRGVAWSWSKRVARPEATAGPSEMARLGPVRVALRWQAYNQLLAFLRSPGPSVLRYEDFADRPAHAARRLLLGARTPGPFLPQFVGERTVKLATDHTVAGNPLRFATGELEIRADEEWRVAMPRWRRMLVTACAFPTSIRYRYP